MYSFHTHRLFFRPAVLNDAPAIWQAGKTAGFADGLLWEPPPSIEELTEHLRQEKISTEHVPLVMEDKNGTFVGRLFFLKRDGEWFIGFWVIPGMQGKGYATEAVKGGLFFAQDALSAQKIFADCSDWNEKSKKVLLRSGFRLVGEGPLLRKKNKLSHTHRYVFSYNNEISQ